VTYIEKKNSMNDCMKENTKMLFVKFIYMNNYLYIHANLW